MESIPDWVRLEYEIGYKEGYEKGYKEGYEKGFKEGLEIGVLFERQKIIHRLNSKGYSLDLVLEIMATPIEEEEKLKN
ncbi:hypothetical protein [Paenibacillus macerans]|uniref:hypothetical protein n=1 Tax=Paenibacillus macerans TaxID=44252 RepID=UPI00203BAEFF|nr:hypothetical protein [Paenibacillus macerans]MCM3703599.1 hypothetical protein [Paenibacillus macerans]